jgi:hypothetical protein
VPRHDRAVDHAERLVLDATRGLVAALHPYAQPAVQRRHGRARSTLCRVRDEVPTCAVCRQDVTPGAPGVIRAVEVFHEQDIGGAPVEAREGKVIFFHEAHVPAETGSYRIN